MRKLVSHCSLFFAIIASSVTAFALEPFASDAEGVEASQCRYPVVTSLSSIEKYFAAKEKSSEKNNFEVLGFKFVNESPFYVKHFKDLIEPTEATKDQLPASVASARGECHTVRCALAKIFGKDESAKILYLLDKYRFNVSPMKYHESGYFKNNDLDLILETMALLPPHLLPLSDLKQLTHVSAHGKNPDNTYGQASIKIYNIWDKASPGKKKYVLFHEIAHNLSKVVSEELDISEEWLAITGWTRVASGFDLAWEHPYMEKYEGYPWVSKYAATNSWEDFAESVSAYRFAPEKLQSLSPARYQFIKRRIFGSIEFKDNQHCQLGTRDQEIANIEAKALKALDLKKEVSNERTMLPESIVFRVHLMNFCGEFLKNAILNKNGAISAFDTCINDEIEAMMKTSYNWMNIDQQSNHSAATFKKAKRNLIDQWLEETFVTESMRSVRWAPTKQFNCHNFAKNYAGLFVQGLEPQTPDNKNTLALKRSLAPAIGYWICADSKTKATKSAKIDADGFDYLKTWLYPRMGL